MSLYLDWRGIEEGCAVGIRMLRKAVLSKNGGGVDDELLDVLRGIRHDNPPWVVVVVGLEQAKAYG